jgi:hypothetical protein
MILKPGREEGGVTLRQNFQDWEGVGRIQPRNLALGVTPPTCNLKVSSLNLTQDSACPN